MKIVTSVTLHPYTTQIMKMKSVNIYPYLHLLRTFFRISGNNFNIHIDEKLGK